MRQGAPDLIVELFAQCKTSKGVLSEEHVRCALASAYRAGYAACLGRLPNNVDDCGVRPPRWPVDEDRVAELAKKFRAELARIDDAQH